MNHQHPESRETQGSGDAPRERRGFRLDLRWVLIGFLLIGGFFLFTEHRAHAIQYLPFVLLALCPLMHLFHGHGGHGGHGNDDSCGIHRHDRDSR